MPTKSAHAELTQLLVAWTAGDEKAFETLSHAVYNELRRGGLTVEETAAVLHVLSDTVLNDWHFAKAWLLRELERG